MDGKESARSWFCVLNNPQDIYSGEPQDIAEQVLKEWVKDYPTRTGAVSYCISADGLIHLHMVLEDSNKARFSSLKKAYPKAHLEPTKGTKEQAEDYIQKKGKFQEKGEQVLYVARHGEIKGNQGARKDFEVIEDLIEQGFSPNQIMDMSFSFRRYESMIRKGYFRKREKETPILRKINVYWHVGESGTGKTFSLKRLVDELGEGQVYVYSDFDNGGLDDYCGEPVLFMDEFRGQIQFGTLMKILQGYKMPLHARYVNTLPLWTEVHISSILPPERVYRNMVRDNLDLDTMKQLFRRINFVIYHFIDEDGKYREFQQPMEEYSDYETLKEIAENSLVEALPEFDIFSEDSSPTETQGKQLDFTEIE